jgi:hypothetical protein
MTKQEFERALILDYLANRENALVFSIYANFKIIYIQVLETYVGIMMSDFNNITKSYTCSIEVLDSKGKIDFDIAYTKLESMINE